MDRFDVSVGLRTNIYVYNINTITSPMRHAELKYDSNWPFSFTTIAKTFFHEKCSVEFIFDRCLWHNFLERTLGSSGDVRTNYLVQCHHEYKALSRAGIWLKTTMLIFECLHHIDMQFIWKKGTDTVQICLSIWYTAMWRVLLRDSMIKNQSEIKFANCKRAQYFSAHRYSSLGTQI